jgi:hypothetical protein
MSISADFATMTMGFHKFDTKDQPLKNFYEIKQHDWTRYHDSQAFIINAANCMSYLPLIGAYIGVARLIFTMMLMSDSFPKSTPHISLATANLLRGMIELTPARPILLILDLAVTTLRQTEYLKSWKFSFDRLSFEGRIIVSINFNPLPKKDFS